MQVPHGKDDDVGDDEQNDLEKRTWVHNHGQARPHRLTGTKADIDPIKQTESSRELRRELLCLLQVDFTKPGRKPEVIIESSNIPSL